MRYALIKNTIIYSLGSIFEKGIVFLLLPLYSLYFSTEDFGIISMMNMLIAIALSFSTSPISNAMQRFYLSPDYKKEKLLFLFLGYLILKVSVLSIFLFSINNYISEHFLNSKELSEFVNYFILVYIISSFSQVFLQVFILEQNAKLVTKLSYIKAIVLFGITSLGLIIDLSLYSVVFGLLGCHLLVLIMLYPRILKKIRYSLEINLLKEPFKYSYPLIPTSLSNNLIQLGDRYILKIFMGLSSVGVYNFAYLLSSFISVLLVTPNKMAFQPIILSKESNPEKLKQTLKKYIVLYFSLGMVLLLWFSAFSLEIMLLVSSSDEFIQGWVIMPIIGYSFLLHGLGNYFGFGLVMAKKSFLISMQTIIAALVNIVLNIILINTFGYIGAAVATFLSYMVWNYMKRKNSEKYYGITFNMKKINEIFLLGIFSILLLYFLNIMIETNIYYKLVYLLVITFFIIFKYIQREDRNKFINIILKKNITNEK